MLWLQRENSKIWYSLDLGNAGEKRMSANLRLLGRLVTGLNGRRSISFVVAASCCCLLGNNMHFGKASQDTKLDVLLGWGKKGLLCRQPGDYIAIMGVREIAQRWAIMFLLEIICVLYYPLPQAASFCFISKVSESVTEKKRFKTVLR